ncbi:MAG: hypothetical protein QOH62_3904, partial [Solirubrobacteraceae bacterium]|nr:hypothetical protein [Solirubrobacteraceae bacterium]
GRLRMVAREGVDRVKAMGRARAAATT